MDILDNIGHFPSMAPLCDFLRHSRYQCLCQVGEGVTCHSQARRPPGYQSSTRRPAASAVVVPDDIESSGIQDWLLVGVLETGDQEQ